MKIIFLMMMILTFNAFADVTPEQLREIEAESVNVMMDMGADPRLNPRVTSVRVISQLGNRVKVKFSYVEQYYGKKTCTFYYDLDSASVVYGSGLCGL